MQLENAILALARFYRTLAKIVMLPIVLPRRMSEKIADETLKEIRKSVLVRLGYSMKEEEIRKYSFLNKITRTISTEFIVITAEALELDASDVQLGAQRLFELLISSRIIRTANALIANSIKEKKQEDVVKHTIVGMLVLEKSKPIAKSYFVLFFSLVAYISICLVTEISFSMSPIFVMGLFGICIFANQWALEYRIRKGLYGNNRYEATEIVEFIQDKIQSDDFTDGSGGFKELFPDAEREERASGVIIGGVSEVH